MEAEKYCMTDNKIAQNRLLEVDKWHYESAIGTLSEILMLNITDLELLKDIYRRRADSYRFLELYENAIQDYSKVFDLQLKLNESPYYHLRALCFQKMGKYHEAINDYSISKNIRYAERAYCYEQIGECDKAILDYKQGINKYTKELEVEDDEYEISILYAAIGDCYKGLKEWENAINNYKLSIESNTEDEELVASEYSKIGDCYIELKDYDEALSSFTHVIDSLRNQPSIIIRQHKDIFDKRSLVYKELMQNKEADKDTIYSSKLHELLKTCKSIDKILLKILGYGSEVYKSTKGRKLDL